MYSYKHGFNKIHSQLHDSAALAIIGRLSMLCWLPLLALYGAASDKVKRKVSCASPSPFVFVNYQIYIIAPAQGNQYWVRDTYTGIITYYNSYLQRHDAT